LTVYLNWKIKKKRFHKLENKFEYRYDGKWVYFWRDPKEDKPKTQVWHVTNTQTNDWLGVISWFPQWRKYAFRSTAKADGERMRILSDIWFEEDCLTDIVNFCKRLTQEQRKKKQVV
jgi:hypothetical protein